MADSDFAGCLDTGKSAIGYMIFMNGAVDAYYSSSQVLVHYAQLWQRQLH